jgi:aryl-alcohol dehydrogenase-like predicted oxidoreductase
MIWNVLEQHPGTPMIEAARRHAPDCCFNIRVTHASGMLEGKYTEDTVFASNDHRRHRPRSWLVNGLQKIRTLDFLAERMTLGQAALKWLLASRAWCRRCPTSTTTRSSTSSPRRATRPT